MNRYKIMLSAQSLRDGRNIASCIGIVYISDDGEVDYANLNKLEMANMIEHLRMGDKIEFDFDKKCEEE